MEVENTFERLARQFAAEARPPAQKFSRRCWGCGVEFQTHIADQRYCSAPCKVRHKRKQAGHPGPQVKPARAVSAQQYQAYLRSEDWQRKAEAAKKRAGFRCQVCNRARSDGYQLEAHHRTYENLGNEQPYDLTVLCELCHGLFSQHGTLATPSNTP